MTIREFLASLLTSNTSEDPTKDEKPGAAAESDAALDVERWTTASTGVRATAQWLATTLGAMAGVVFGAGPLINNKTDVSKWDSERWTLVLGVAAVGVVGIVAIVSRLVVAMLPVEVTLDELPKKLRTRIKEAPDVHLPGTAKSLKDFEDRLASYAVGAARVEIAARRETDPARKKLLEDRAKILSDNRDLYQAKRSELLAKAKYRIESGRLGGFRNALWFSAAGLAAVLGISSFTFLTHAPAKDADEAPSPQGAVIIPKSGSEELWATLNLDACSGQQDGVPVLLLGTSGENSDHYKVVTLGQPSGCGRYSFTVSDQIVDLVVPEPVEVDLTEPTAPTN